MVQILVVEDDLLLSKALERRLRGAAGVEVTFAGTVREGMVKLEGVDVALVDLYLPDGLGTELLRVMRLGSHRGRVAIFSGRTDAGTLVMASGERPDAIFFKPLDLDKVVGWILSEGAGADAGAAAGPGAEGGVGAAMTTGVVETPMMTELTAGPVRLPVERAEDRDSARLNILVVEDERDSREFVARYLEREGHAVSVAADGQTALRMLLNQRADAVVLDVRMPVMDGIALLEVLRSYLRWHTLPVILVTAQATPEEMRKARDLGVTYIFHKAGYDLVELGRAIAALCDPPDGGVDSLAG